MSLRLWSPATIFKSCLGCCFESILRLAWLSTIVTSMSATAHWFCCCCWAIDSFAVAVAGESLHWVARVEYWGKEKNWANGEEEEENPLVSGSCFVLLWTSMDCNNCSNSFTKLIAPPIIDAWSPYNTTINKSITTTTIRFSKLWSRYVVKVQCFVWIFTHIIIY